MTALADGGVKGRTMTSMATNRRSPVRPLAAGMSVVAAVVTLLLLLPSQGSAAPTGPEAALRAGAPRNSVVRQGGAAGSLLISELRTSGPGGAGDDFIELYNNTDVPLTVQASDVSPGYGVFKMGATCNDLPVLVAVISNMTSIPARGHRLLAGSAYSLANYGGTGAAAGDQPLSADVENDRNVGIFTTTNAATLSAANRLDAVGFGTNTGGNCDLLREGSTLPAASGSTLQYSFFRKERSGRPQDTNDNAADFLYADTTGDPTPAGQRLGAPGPQNSSNPVNQGSGTPILLLDQSRNIAAAPNLVRVSGNDGINTDGTLSLRRRIPNNTTGPVTRLRFRIVDLTTRPASGTADLRARTSIDTGGVQIFSDSTTCGGPPPCTVTVKGTSVETPPAQPSGGGFNSTWTLTLGTPLSPGQSVNAQFVLGVMQGGPFNVCFVAEVLPGGGSAVSCLRGSVNGNTVVVAPTISKAFGASSIPFNGSTTLTFTITNPNQASLSGLSFTDALPSGLVVADTPGASTTCGGSFTPSPGATSLSFSGGAVNGSQSCTVKVDVKGTAPGTKNNTTSAISSTESGQGEPSNTATVEVGSPPTPTNTRTPTRTPTPSLTPVPTSTPTPSRPPTMTPTPFPRPNLGVQVAPATTAGQMQATITARDANCSPNNSLQSLRFTRLTNATVDVPGVGNIAAASATPIALAGQPASVVLTVRRVTAGQAATVELAATDGCGEWPTFVGGGPSAF